MDREDQEEPRFVRTIWTKFLISPPDLRESMSEDRLAHHVGDLVDAVDLEAFHALYREGGRCDARMMVSY